jgi:ATP-dependent helicase/DNAse subunit B
VGTLAHFLEVWGASWQIPPAAPKALLQMLVSEALDQLRPPRFTALRESRELHLALAELIEELPEQGHPLASVTDHVRAGLRERGCALRQARLRDAAAKLREGGITALPAQIVIDGFFDFGPAEIDLIEALASRTSVVITLPETSRIARRLEAIGFELRQGSGQFRAAKRTLFSAPTSEREAEEIARRILEYVEHGRRFREIGIILRSREPYAALLETTLARFGIPARSYFADPLASHPAVAYLTRLVNAFLSGWDRAELASALRMPVSGTGATPAGDLLDFEFRKQMPGSGLLPDCPAPLAAIPEDLRSAPLTPLEWAEQLQVFRKLLPAPEIPTTPAERGQVYAWRSTAAAIQGFEKILRETASFLSSEKITLSQFWPHVEAALSLEPLRVEDRRRDVVHIMDVFEARQWELPVVFVCGMRERLFPQYHRDDALLGDLERVRLGLSTALQRQQEERFLFELAVTRGSEETILSYPRFNEKGEETLRSFFLEDSTAVDCDHRVRPAPLRSVTNTPSAKIREAESLARLPKIHRKLSPTGIESFLQCPFQFFARRTLGLRERPPAPRDRLTILEQGQIIHRACAEWARFPLLGAQVLGRVFEEECAKQRIPGGYRTEAVRLELLRNFETFLDTPGLNPGPNSDWSIHVEEDFRFALDPDLTIRGRIDRLETDSYNQALVIDYKYSPGNKVRERVADSEEGNLVQAGLYMLAAERAFGLTPVGMLYCGLKKDVSWGGWHLELPGLDRIGESHTAEALRELMDRSAYSAIKVHESIVAGEIAVQPRDSKKCAWCDYRDACRVETHVGQASRSAASLQAGSGNLE